MWLSTIILLASLFLCDVLAQEQWVPWKPECSCWVLPQRRSACNYYDMNMPQERCESLGCCYEDGGPVTQPSCFRPTGFCPPTACQISPAERLECLIRQTRSRESCFDAGCCYNQATKPHCYQSQNGSEVDRYVYETGDKLFEFSDGSNIVDSGSKDISFGPNKMRFICPNVSQATLCGRRIQSKNQCLRMGCCWNPTSRGTCWKAIINLLNLPVIIPPVHWSVWGSWSTCSNTTVCSSGVQNRTRTCVKTNGNTHNCSGLGFETRICGGCTPSWGKWGPYGACSSAETNCLIGKKKSVRQCTTEHGYVLPEKTCVGGKSASSKSKKCNVYLCSSFTAWSSPNCSASCGGGTQVQTRQCTKPPRGILFPECLSRAVACNTAPCISDKSLDLLLMLDSNAALDDCFGKSRKLSSNFPYLAGNPYLTPVNFPNFFQQNKFAKLLLSSWKNVTLTSTRVAIAQLSQNCNPMTSKGYHVKKYLDSEYDSFMLDSSMSYYCENDPTFSQFTCGVKILSRANRPNVPDVIIAFVPDMTLYGKRVLDFYRQNFHYISALTSPATLFTISAADHSSMTKSASVENQLFCRQMACGSFQPTCGRYLGTIYDNVNSVVTKFRKNVIYL